MLENTENYSEELRDAELDTLAWNNMTPEAERAIDRIEKRIEMGLEHLPLDGEDEVFTEVSEPRLNILEIIEDVAGWFVRKDTKFFDVNNIGIKFTRKDAEKIVLARIRAKYPYLQIADDLKRDIFSTLYHDDLYPVTVFETEQQFCLARVFGSS